MVKPKERNTNYFMRGSSKVLINPTVGEHKVTGTETSSMLTLQWLAHIKKENIYYIGCEKNELQVEL